MNNVAVWGTKKEKYLTDKLTEGENYKLTQVKLRLCTKDRYKHSDITKVSKKIEMWKTGRKNLKVNIRSNIQKIATDISEKTKSTTKK